MRESRMTEFEKLEEFINQALFAPGGNFVQLVKRCIKKNKEAERALWMARAKRAGAEANRCSVSKSHAHRVCSNNIKDYFNLKYKKWCWVERKCIEKAKEFE